MADAFTFTEQARYFERKLNLPTDSYLDVVGEEHDYFFVVAGANRNEVLLALRAAVDAAIHNGETLEAFRARFDGIVAKTGWSYQGGRNWRSRIIYDTNIYGAYNRGRLLQQLELAEELPYWEYEHNDNAHPRAAHVALDGTIRPAGDEFWRYYYPIKAYGCHCTVRALSAAQMAAKGKQVSPPPQITYTDKLVGVRSGSPRSLRLPAGYDAGFVPHDFAALKAGRNQSADVLLLQKMQQAEPQFAARLIEDVLNKRPQAQALLNQGMGVWVDEVLADGKPRGAIKYVGVIPSAVIAALEQLGKAPASAVIAMRDQDLLHATRELHKERDIGIPLDFWRTLPEKLLKPQAILLQPKESFQGQDKALDTLLFVYDTEQGKLAVKLDFIVALHDALSGQKRKREVNLLRTGTIYGDMKGLAQYPLLWGSR